MSLPPQQHVEPPIAETPALSRQLAQPLAQRLVRRPARAVPHARPVSSDNPAGPPLAHAVDRPEMLTSLPARGGPYHFFASRSFSAAASRIASAKSFFSRGFSASSCSDPRPSATA